MSDKINAEMILKHDIFHPPVLSLPGILSHTQTGLTMPFYSENDTGKLQKIHLSVRDDERSGFYAENEQEA